jgi:uncharacterized protein (DUF3084 family)
MLKYLGLSFGLMLAASAQQPSPAEVKLREQLRSTMLQLRTLETEKATLTAEKATLEAEKKEANDKLDALTKKHDALTMQSAKDREAADRKEAELTDNVAVRDKELARQLEALKKWKIAHTQVTNLARKKEEDRLAAVQKGVELERVVAEQRRKNVELYKVADEILTKYSKFGLGEAIVAREPFTGAMRVRLQNLSEDYKDKILDQVIKP